MKKYTIALLTAALALSLCACGRKMEDMPIIDEMPTVTMPDPTSGTNIPDPTVNENSTENGSLIDGVTDMIDDMGNG